MNEAAPGAEAPLDDRLDNRAPGDWGSRYGRSAWVQIAVEFGYLAVVLVTTTAMLVWIGYQVGPPSPLDTRSFSLLGLQLEYPRDRAFLLWLAVALSGAVGGTCFALKWLYHAVAKAEWNRDRILWRLIVPPVSGTVALFFSMLAASGAIPLVDSRFFSGFYGAIGVGWLIGYFSDNALAALQKLARKWFGTVDEGKGSVSASGDRGTP